MINYDFNPDTVAREMTKNWQGYYEHSYSKQQKSLYKIIKTFTHSKIKAKLASSFYSLATTLFAISKKPGEPHRHRKKKTFVLLTSITVYILLNINYKKLCRLVKPYTLGTGKIESPTDI